MDPDLSFLNSTRNSNSILEPKQVDKQVLCHIIRRAVPQFITCIQLNSLTWGFHSLAKGYIHMKMVDWIRAVFNIMRKGCEIVAFTDQEKLFDYYSQESR
ncbi:hypothetical protein MPH_04443 [Macrophomina phaseolina MS6]|uniref:Uncharacterized protein n=1 Tax=Macrophomina phaseolina (strain MS6) TaxID=1126212 RepID=K2R7F8_MACPH|nr:hypothetical protein MPH_04443 [Macrophomina phaseolina MS6]